MKQYNYVITSLCEIDEIITELSKHSIWINAKTKLLQIYSATYEDTFIHFLIERMKEKAPDVYIAGMTAFSVINNEKKYENSASLSFLLFLEADVTVLSYSLQDDTAEEIGCKIMDQINKCEYIAGVQLFSTFASKELSGIVKSLSSDRYPVFGAVAGRGNNTEMVRLSSSVFSEAEYKEGLVAVLYHGKDLHVEADFCLGWKPLGVGMTVTKVNESFCVEEIDGRPAVEVYKKYLQVQPDENFVGNTFEFPLSINRNEQMILRAPYLFDKRGGLYFNADIFQGEKMRFSYGNEKYVLEAAEMLSNTLYNFRPDALFLIACLNRDIFYKTNVEKELSLFSKAAEYCGGAYVFSEILRKGDSGGVLHSSLVAVGMREGEKNTDETMVESLLYKREETNVKPFSERLIYFLEAISCDLEKMSVTDKLTELFNRRKLEEIYVYESGKRINKNSLSLCLIDVDYFKKINDEYGHDIGDYVLRELAKVFKDSIREGDTVGRWGGEEFMIILPMTSLQEAKQIANRICSEVNNHEYDHGSKVSVSIGVVVRKDAEDMNQIFTRVDQALYCAKNRGRNRVIGEDDIE